MHDTIITTTETITPKIAESWLRLNVKNRKVKLRHLAGLCSAMRSGRFRLNGESIKFTKSGNLVDGQHRLLACMRTQIPFISQVTRGLDDDIFPTLDRGAKRSSADALSWQGIKNANVMASSIRWIIALRQNVDRSAIDISPDDALEMYPELPGIQHSFEMASPCKQILNVSIGTSLHFLFHEKNRLQADAFFKDICDGTGLAEHDPVLILRNKLIAIRLNDHRKRVTPSSEVVAIVIRAWNARRQNRTLSVLKGLVKNDDGKLIMPIIE